MPGTYGARLDLEKGLGYGSVMFKKHTDEQVDQVREEANAVIASMRESDKAGKLTLQEAFDKACEIATTQRLNQVQHDEAVAKIADLRARAGSS